MHEQTEMHFQKARGTPLSSKCVESSFPKLEVAEILGQTEISHCTNGIYTLTSAAMVMTRFLIRSSPGITMRKGFCF